MTAHQLYIHLAWTTRDRRPMIDPPTSVFLSQHFREAVEEAEPKTGVAVGRRSGSHPKACALC